MKQLDYIPKPLDTSNIKLPEELIQLVEMLAENTHEVWAKGRLDNGWTYSPLRNDYTKGHPCLVPYDKLSEEEKEFDRRTSIETLKFILSKGYKITR